MLDAQRRSIPILDVRIYAYHGSIIYVTTTSNGTRRVYGAKLHPASRAGLESASNFQEIPTFIISLCITLLPERRVCVLDEVFNFPPEPFAQFGVLATERKLPRSHFKFVKSIKECRRRFFRTLLIV